MENQLDLPKGLLASVRTRGERTNSDQVSSAGARTVYQVTPTTRSLVMNKYGVDAYAGPQQAALAAGYILREGLDRNGGNRAAAVAEYHGGTDHRQHGPITKSYVARVTGDGGRSTYDRVQAKRAADREAQSGPSLAKVYAAYRQGRMSPEQAAQFEHDVNAGAILLPPGGQLKKTPAAPQLPAGVVSAYNDMNSGMTIEQRQQIDSDLQEGVVSLPRSAKLNAWRPMTTAENIKRGLGLGVRSIIEGVGEAGGLVNTVLNATGLPQRLAGKPLAMPNDPSVNIADKLGLPKPQFDSERLLSAVERGATGGLLTYGAGTAIGALPGVTGAVGRAIASAPVTDVVSGGLSGGASESARQAGFGPMGQFAAGLAGGFAGVGGAVAAERSIARVAGRKSASEVAATTPRDVVIDSRGGELTEEGQELIARHGFSPDEVKRAYDDSAAAPGGDEVVSVATRPDVAEAEARVQQALENVGRSGGRVELRNGESISLDPAMPSRVDPNALAAAEVELGAARRDLDAARAAADRTPPVAAPPPPPPEPLPTVTAPTQGSASAPTPSAGRTSTERTLEAEEMGIPLTRGQATQNFALQDAEQTLSAQASGEGDKARKFLVEQADKIKAAATRFRESFGSPDLTKTERGQLVKDALRELRDQGRSGINALYREAQQMGGDAIPLDRTAITETAKRVLVEADVPDGVKNVIRQEMARYGMLGKNAVTAEDGLTTVKLNDGRKVQFYGDPEPLTIGNAERFRQAISAQYMTDGPRKLSQSIKGAVDDAVEAAVESAARNGVDGPVGAKLGQARQAVVEQKETFAAKDVVQKLIDWRKGTRTDVVLPEFAIRDVLAGDLSNLGRVKSVLLSKPTPKSKAAWSEVVPPSWTGLRLS
ncbi:lytic transglycosylase domain-containing protein [Sphingomonas sp. NPDC019816]|uniref:lytic transglycosylase domain-containing protein n=1 Tax=Sphingomonas sp. NPDC019816 TaxID=3390679 RepID=UPI003CFCDDCC